MRNAFETARRSYAGRKPLLYRLKIIAEVESRCGCCEHVVDVRFSDERGSDVRDTGRGFKLKPRSLNQRNIDIGCEKICFAHLRECHNPVACFAKLSGK